MTSWPYSMTSYSDINSYLVTCQFLTEEWQDLMFFSMKFPIEQAIDELFTERAKFGMGSENGFLKVHLLPTS